MYGNSVVILLNLIAGSIYEADRIACDLVNSLLTLARHSVRSALVAYDEHEVTEMTPLMPSHVLLSKALQTIKCISTVKPSVRYLWPPDIEKINIARRQLANVDQQAAQKLVAFLDMEREVCRTASSHHPLSAALSKLVYFAAPPAMLVPITSFNHDAEVLSYMLPRLKERGYKLTQLEATNAATGGIVMNMA